MVDRKSFRDRSRRGQHRLRQAAGARGRAAAPSRADDEGALAPRFTSAGPAS